MVTPSLRAGQSNPFDAGIAEIFGIAGRNVEIAAARMQPRGGFPEWLRATRLSALERRLVRHENQSLSGPTEDVVGPRLRPAEEDQAAQLLKVTETLFPPGALAVARECDPMNPTDEYLVVDVLADGDTTSILQRKAAWHAEVALVVPGDTSWLRLCIYPR